MEIEGQYHNVYVIKRPGVDQFMKRVGELYEVVVFTASVSKVTVSSCRHLQERILICISTEIRFLTNLTSTMLCIIACSGNPAIITKAITSKISRRSAVTFARPSSSTTRPLHTSSIHNMLYQSAVGFQMPTTTSCLTSFQFWKILQVQTSETSV